MEESDFDAVVNDLKENSIEVLVPALDAIIEFTDNIRKHPNEQECRKLLLTGSLFEGKLLPVSGALDCLFLSGFKEGSSYIFFPDDAPLKNLELLSKVLKKMKNGVQKKQEDEKKNPHPATYSNPGGEREILSILRNYANIVNYYEDSKLQQKARDVLPVGARRPDVSSEEQRLALLTSVVKWFKLEFFSWYEAPSCCSKLIRSSATPTLEESRWLANRVELYVCPGCNAKFRFPRYNHPEKLLETRVGRCGEWANCFTLICRSLGYDARFIVDTLDHVWTEVWIKPYGRWVHIDPCEAVMDKPLLYEMGWGKKLSYVFAISKHEVQDVTWRYVRNFNETLKRRTKVSESWLRARLRDSCMDLQRNLRIEQRQTIEERRVLELAEFCTPPKPNENTSLGGRTTGSLEWRQARGELGNQLNEDQRCVVTLTPKEKEAKRLVLEYSCRDDVYLRGCSEQEILTGWPSLVYSAVNLFRKEELDWKMVYLARKDGDKPGHIMWKFSFQESGLRIKKASIQFKYATFDCGIVQPVISTDQICFPLHGASEELKSIPCLLDKTEFSLVTTLRGGSGDCSYQHAQLFRQNMKSRDDSVMRIVVDFH